MLLAGKNIQAAAESLQKIELEHLFQSLQHPHPVVESRMRQLRIVRQTDAKLYTKLKKTLPYFVCGNFTPPIRKTENFAYIVSAFSAPSIWPICPPRSVNRSNRTWQRSRLHMIIRTASLSSPYRPTIWKQWRWLEKHLMSTSSCTRRIHYFFDSTTLFN